MCAKEKIEIKNLSIGYRTKNRVRLVAENLRSTIQSGELTCLLGANGVGKSTLLRTLSGFQPPLSGEIFIARKEIRAYSKKELARIIGVVLTEKVDVRDMSVTELIALGRSPYTGFWGKLNQDDETVVKNAVSLIKIEELAHRPLQTLSDGERQKVMIAKALAQETPVICLDEPTAFLDFPSKVEIMRLLHRLTRQAGKTVFLSTHDLELALQMADRLWLMDKAKGITIGTPRELTLNGSLENFVQCEGVVFDRQTGLFRIEKQNDSLF
jgi:iron complex transport system ATP-binding protein